MVEYQDARGFVLEADRLLSTIMPAISAKNADAAKAVQERAAPLEEALRKTIENRPYTAVAVALAIGWFVGRMSRMD